MADPLRVLQILDNLVSNALKFTAEGSVEIWAELLERAEGIDTVCFSVKDTGIGIEAEAQARLFQPFEQAAATTARLYGGTGLGLSISRRLAEMMGGTIHLESTPGSGTTVGLTLPLSIGEPPVGGPENDSSQIVKIFVDGASQGVEPIVLAVDDHPTNRELLARQIEALGLLAQTAADGREAFALWKAGGIALVVTDCNMPEMDGYALSRTIREHEESEGLSRTPIIAWTANVLPSAAALCRAAGMDDILTKPAELNALRKTLTAWLPAAVTSALQPEVPVAALSLAGLSKIAATPAQRAEILVDFISNSESDLSDLRAAQRISDLPACARIAHRMLGSSRMIGANELADLCEDMERAARMGSSEEVMKTDAAMDGALVRLDAHLAEAKRVIAE